MFHRIHLYFGTELLQLAPERLRTLGVYGPSARATSEGDMYGFGMILYQVLFRSRPFDIGGVTTAEGDQSAFSIETNLGICTEILQQLIEPTDAVIRPIIMNRQRDINVDLVKIVQECMSEQPDVRPTVVSFMDEMLKSNDNLRVEEIRVPDDFSGRRLDQFGAASRDFLFVAVRELGEWQFNPPPEFMVKPGHILVVIATPLGRKTLEQRIATMA